MEIKNAVAMITGGASGMGLETAMHLTSLGANVAVLDVNQQQIDAIKSKINNQAYHCDVTDEKNIQAVIETIKKTMGTPSICVNCAGRLHAKRMIGKTGLMPLSEYEQIIRVNLTGTFNMMRLAANAMKDNTPLDQNGSRGVIINTASIAAYEGQIGQLAYSASKGGIVAMTLPAARELATFGIRVMTIAPGLVETPMFEQLSDDAKQSLANMVPFPKRLAKPHEFAMLVAHIIENDMLNGEVIRLDGGIRMQPK